MDELSEGAERVAQGLRGRTLACAESCTAGIVAQALAAVEGSGEWFVGGVVAYQELRQASTLASAG